MVEAQIAGVIIARLALLDEAPSKAEVELGRPGVDQNPQA